MSARFADSYGTLVLVTLADGETKLLSRADDLDDIIALGQSIEPYQPTAADVRAEAHRRVCIVIGAVNTAHAALIIGDNARELRALIEAGDGTGTIYLTEQPAMCDQSKRQADDLTVTPEMISAGLNAAFDRNSQDDIDAATVSEIFLAMLEAAPQGWLSSCGRWRE